MGPPLLIYIIHRMAVEVAGFFGATPLGRVGEPHAYTVRGRGGRSWSCVRVSVAPSSFWFNKNE